MKLLSLATATYALHSAARLEQNARVSAIEKVVELLQKMKQKGLSEIAAEKEQYQKYFMFCHDTSRDKANQIADGEEVVTDAENTEKVQMARAAELAKQIAEHNAQIARNTLDLENTEAIRKSEHAEFQKTNQDYAESLDAMDRAKEVLSAQNKDIPAAKAALLQLSSSRAASGNPSRVSQIQKTIAVLQGDEDALDSALPSTPQANVYESSLDKVIAMLDKLQEEFREEQTKLQKAEMNASHNYEMFVQDVSTDSENRKSQVESQTVDMSAAKEAAAGARKLKADTMATLESDKAYKADLDATCAKKASDFERRTDLRNQEIEAIQKAVEILSSDAVSGNGAKHGMIQPAEPEPETSFLSFTQRSSLRRNYASINPEALQRVRNILNNRSHSLHSSILSNLVLRITATEGANDAFSKVIDMIRDLIAKMQQEAAEEAKQKAWCDKNLKLNERDRSQFTKDVKKGEAKSDTLNAQISQAAKELSQLEKDILDATDALSTATTKRGEEKETNTQTIAEAKAAQEAIAKATVVLKEFYDKASTAASFIQEPDSRNPDAPEIFDTPYTGMGGESGGILGILEVIQSDFARLEAETTAAEANASDEYEKFREDTQLNLAVKKKDVAHTKETKTRDEATAKATETALEESRGQLKAARDTFEKLKPPCIGTPIDYEARVKAREAEIKSLKECIEILESQ